MSDSLTSTSILPLSKTNAKRKTLNAKKYEKIRIIISVDDFVS
jgi:hypothetical protein